jgi:predicted  nucleic acid-binding Zn-ribbon protein
VSAREREGLIARIRQARRLQRPTDQAAAPTSARDSELAALEQRLTHMESLLQGLQDSVHRESKRLSDRIAQLEAEIQPAAMGKALSDDARKRGL